MGSEWREVALGEICQIFDGPHATPKKTTEGPVFLGISSLANGRLDLTQSARLSEHDFKRWTRRVTPQEGDIVFSYETRLGEAAIIPAGLRCCLGRRMGLLRPDRDKVDPKFLLYYYLGPQFQQVIRARTVHGSTVDRILLTEMGSFPVVLPPLPEQRAIAHILGTLDDKIELNWRMNATLEAMARALFQSWFVDFDPVWENVRRKEENARAPGRKGAKGEEGLRALASSRLGVEKENARAQGRKGATEDLAAAHPGAPSLPEEILALFPDAFEESALGLIPRGWRVSTIGEVIELAYGKALKASARIPGNVPVYGSNGAVGWHNEALVVGPGIIVGRKGNPGTVTWSSKDFYPIDTTFYVKRIGDIESLYYLYYALEHQNLSRLSSDSAVPGLNRNMAYMNNILVPESQVVAAFDEQLVPLFERIDANEEESRTLAGLRDTLLPRLISGELRVEDAERFLAEAGV